MLTPARDVVGCILAGGLARRMGGGDKPLALLGGRPMLVHVIERFAPQVDALVVNANGDPARFAPFGLPVVNDTVDGHPGPLAGVLAGMRYALAHRPGARYLATAAGDTPFLPIDLVARLRAAAADGPATIAVPTSATGSHQTCALVPLALADELEAGLADGSARKVLAWMGRYRIVEVFFEGSGTEDPFFNVNTQEDLAALQDRAMNSQRKQSRD